MKAVYFAVLPPACCTIVFKFYLFRKIFTEAAARDLSLKRTGFCVRTHWEAQALFKRTNFHFSKLLPGIFWLHEITLYLVICRRVLSLLGVCSAGHLEKNCEEENQLIWL